MVAPAGRSLSTRPKPDLHPGLHRETLAHPPNNKKIQKQKAPQNIKQKQVRVQIAKSKLPFLKSMDYKVTLLKWYKSVTEEIS